MILQALADYYRRKQTDPDPARRLPAYGFEEKEIPFILEIDREGQLVQIIDTRSGEGKKKTAQRFLVPRAVKRTSSVAANLLWDTAEYVLGVDTRGKPERVAKQHAAFRARIDTLPAEVQEDPGVAAVRAFLEHINFDTLAAFPTWEEIKTTNPYLSFRLHGDVELVCQRPAVINFIGEEPDDEATVTCLISGKKAAPERCMPPSKACGMRKVPVRTSSPSTSTLSIPMASARVPMRQSARSLLSLIPPRSTTCWPRTRLNASRWAIPPPYSGLRSRTSLRALFPICSASRQKTTPTAVLTPYVRSTELSRLGILP